MKGICIYELIDQFYIEQFVLFSRDQASIEGPSGGSTVVTLGVFPVQFLGKQPRYFRHQSCFMLGLNEYIAASTFARVHPSAAHLL